MGWGANFLSAFLLEKMPFFLQKNSLLSKNAFAFRKITFSSDKMNFLLKKCLFLILNPLSARPLHGMVTLCACEYVCPSVCTAQFSRHLAENCWKVYFNIISKQFFCFLIKKIGICASSLVSTCYVARLLYFLNEMLIYRFEI